MHVVSFRLAGLITLIAIVTTSLTATTAATTVEPGHLTPTEANADVDLFRRTIETIHPGYGRYTSAAAMDALFDDLRRSVEGGTTDLDLYREISRVLTHIRCDHTKAELPERLETMRRTTPSYLPFSFRLFDGRMYVDRIDASSTVLTRGDEVLAINGRTTGRILADVEDYVSVDGWTDETKVVEMEYSSEYLGDAIDHFWPMLYGWPDDWSVEIRRRATGEIERHTLKPLTYEGWLAMATDGSSRFVDFPDTVAFEMRDEHTGCLSIGTFVNYRNPVAPETVFDPIFDQLRDAGATRLIIDLRQCGGGSDDVPEALATYLSDTVVPAAKRPAWVRTYTFGDLRDHLSTWDPSVFQLPATMFTDLGNGYFELNQPVPGPRPAPERDNRFGGEIVVLSSAANASGATIFIALLQAHTDAVIVGEPTGGSAEGPTAGIMLFLDLPHSGIRVRVPAIRSWINVPHPIAGRGVMPDVLVRPTVEDWLRDRDVVLETAL